MADEPKATRASWLPKLGWPERLFLAALAGWLLAALSGSVVAQGVTQGLALLLGATALFRATHFYLSKFIWRLRNRMLVTFFFISVIPVGLLLAFAVVGTWLAAGMVAVYVGYQGIDRELGLLGNTAFAIARAEPASSQLRTEVEARFPGSMILSSTAGAAKPGHGLTIRDGVLNGWATNAYNGRRVTILVPLGRTFFDRLDPDLGIITVGPGLRSVFRLAAPARQEGVAATIPPPAFSYDPIIQGAGAIKLRDFDVAGTQTGAPRDGLIFVGTRLSALYRRLTSIGFDSSTFFIVVLASIAVAIFIAEIVSLVIGVAITRTMTAAVHNLYEGTQRVMQGDFSYRIPVKGSEQIADLSRSFNTMTENVERLLIDSKEKERMQAELEIARSVQQQLFPARMPEIQSMELHAVCQAARQVSGDYYDCQPLGDGRVVIVLGDVAGKGISAALLMASLQSTLRIQLREWHVTASTERLAKGINQHLFLNTAPEKYATLFLAIFDPATGELEYTNAGHLPPMVVHEGRTTLLDVNGMVVGAFQNAPLSASRVTLAPGDMLVCYTDGVTELENEFQEQFGADRLSSVLCRCNGANLEQVAADILSATQQFSGSSEAQDDLTMLLLRRRA
jgi:sigma-B regulation protein RsbU (phosphoserine phosphatase)